MLKYRMPSRYLQLPWLLPGPLPDSKSCYHNSANKRKKSNALVVAVSKEGKIARRQILEARLELLPEAGSSFRTPSKCSPECASRNPVLA